MGFDNECILNIQTLPGEYFCPVCRTLVYPTEALQTQCTHLYCRPCLAHTAATTQACPYDGYLVTQADSKPLIELNKPLADAIGKVQVHCLYYRSSCPWQGTFSECIAHCSTCSYGNSPVLCNRCGTQIMHRQVQEHAQVCPVLPPQVSQPVDPAQPQTAAVTSQYAGQNVYSTTVATAAAPVQTSAPGVSSQAAGDQWYQQQYHQQYPGYDPYAQYAQQPQSQVAPFAVHPPQSQSAVPQMQVAAQNVPAQPPYLQSHQQPQPSQPQPNSQFPPLQPLPTPQSQLQLTPQGLNPAPSPVTGYSSYPQSQHAPTQQPHMQMPPLQQPLTPPSRGSYAPPPQQMASQQQLQAVGPGTHAQRFGPPHAHGQALGAGVPLGLNHGTPPPPQFQPSPSGSLKAAYTSDETNGKINQFLEGYDDKAVSNVGPTPSQNTAPATLPQRYLPYGNSPDMPPYGQGQIRMPHNSSARPYNEVSMRPSMATSPQSVPEPFDPMGWQPQPSFEPPFSRPGMVRSNGLHAPLHDERLRSYYRQPLEGLSKYERSLYPSRQDEFYRPSGAEYGLGPPPFRGGRHEYEGVSPKRFGADYGKSRLPINLPPPDGRSGAKRFGEPGGYRRYSGPGHMPPSGNYGAVSEFCLFPYQVFPGGKGSSVERSRKRSFLTVGWCRICKIDCGTAEGLDSHSQSKDHKKMALDMIFSIKQQVSKKPKMLIEREVNDVKDGSDEVDLDTRSRT